MPPRTLVVRSVLECCCRESLYYWRLLEEVLLNRVRCPNGSRRPGIEWRLQFGEVTVRAP